MAALIDSISSTGNPGVVSVDPHSSDDAEFVFPGISDCDDVQSVTDKAVSCSVAVDKLLKLVLASAKKKKLNIFTFYHSPLTFLFFKYIQLQI